MLKAVALALLLLAPTAAFAGTTEQVDQAITDNLGDPAASTRRSTRSSRR